MATVDFREVDIIIDGSGILAESASISSETALSPLYALGYKLPLTQSAEGGLQSNFRFSYWLEASYDPNYENVRFLRTGGRYTYNHSPATLVIGGVTGLGYITDYQINLSPNQGARASANYVCFNPLSGQLENKSNEIHYNTTKTSGIAHGWTVYIVNDTMMNSHPIYDFNYNFNADWSPLYILGNIYPNQVQFSNANESINITRDTYSHLTFSGQASTGFFGSSSDTYINILGLYKYRDASSPYNLQIDIRSGIVKQRQLQASLDDIVRSEITINNHF